MARRRQRFRKKRSGIFLPGDLDDPNRVETAGEISFFAQQVLPGFDARPCGRRLLICPTGKSVSAVP
jgi:hypothetical protein